MPANQYPLTNFAIHSLQSMSHVSRLATWFKFRNGYNIVVQIMSDVTIGSRGWIRKDVDQHEYLSSMRMVLDFGAIQRS